MAEVPELSPSEFMERWSEGISRDELVLLDVREPVELTLASVHGACHIPMMDVPKRFHELPRDKPLVVMCHAGARSRRVAEFLASQGFEQVFNFRGGIDAWSREIDRSVPRY